jgi:hypothetical protein
VSDNSLRGKLTVAEKRIASLLEELQRAQASSFNDGSDESATIAHIKGNLTVFLKHTPLTDTKNEEMLRIVFSMMEFTKQEIEELKTTRSALKLNAQGKVIRGKSGDRSKANVHSASNHSNTGGVDTNEDI